MMDGGRGEFSFEISTCNYNVNPTNFSINVDDIDQLRGRNLSRRGEWEVGLLDMAVSDKLDLFGRDEYGRSLGCVCYGVWKDWRHQYLYRYIPFGMKDDVPAMVDLVNGYISEMVNQKARVGNMYTAGQWFLDHMFRLQVDEASGKVIVKKKCNNAMTVEINDATGCGLFFVYQIYFSDALLDYFGFQVETLPYNKEDVPKYYPRKWYWMYICTYYWKYTWNIPKVLGPYIPNRSTHVHVHSNLVRNTLAVCPVPIKRSFDVQWRDMEKVESVKAISIRMTTPDGREPFFRGDVYFRIGIRPKAVEHPVQQKVGGNWALSTSHTPSGVFSFDIVTDDYPDIDPTCFSIAVADVKAFRDRRVDFSTPMEISLSSFSMPNNIMSFAKGRAFIHMCVRHIDSGKHVFRNHTVHLPRRYYGDVRDLVRAINADIVGWWRDTVGAVSASGINVVGEYFNRFMCSVDIDPVSDFVFISHPDDADHSVFDLFELMAFRKAGTACTWLQEMTMWASNDLIEYLGPFDFSKAIWEPPNKATPPVGSSIIWQRMRFNPVSILIPTHHAYINNPLANVHIITNLTRFVSCIAICDVNHGSESISYTAASRQWDEMVRNMEHISITLLSSSGKRVLFKGGNICLSFSVRPRNHGAA